ncbi:MAG: tetratricopeptide repeat protein [Ignavibacteria bacterium]
MKNCLLLTLLILFFVSFGFASEADDFMKKGNALYQSGNYGQAIEAYQKLVNNGYVGKSLFYNLGNAYFRAGRTGFAILNYEKALKLAPNEEDIIYNLKIANARTVDKIEVLPKIFFVRWWDGLVNAFTVNGWTVFMFVVYLITLLTIGLYFLSGSAMLQKLSVVLGLFMIIILICTTALLAIKYNNDANCKSGIVVENSAVAKLSPDMKSGDAFVIHEGLKVDFEDEFSGWVKIKLADGKEGWVVKSDLGSI